MEPGELGDRHLIRPRRGGDKLVVMIARYSKTVIKDEGDRLVDIKHLGLDIGEEQEHRWGLRYFRSVKAFTADLHH